MMNATDYVRARPSADLLNTLRSGSFSYRFSKITVPMHGLSGLDTVKLPSPSPHHLQQKAYQVPPQIPHKADKQQLQSYPVLLSI